MKLPPGTKRLIALAITIGLLWLIFARVDRGLLAEHLRSTRLGLFGLALSLFVPQIGVMAWRWRMLARHFVEIPPGRAVGLILAGLTMNLVLPSKMGDFTKAIVLHRSGALDLPRATHLVVFEKALDMGSLCLLALVGVAAVYVFRIPTGDPVRFGLLAALAVSMSVAAVAAVFVLYFVPFEKLGFFARWLNFLAARPRLARLHRAFSTTHEVASMLQADKRRRAVVCFASVGLWGLHLLQIGLFFASLGATVPPVALAALMPLAIFVGLLPISIGGIGTRDAAIIFLFAPYETRAVLVAAALYVNLRYLVTALAGVPFLGAYIGLARQARQTASESERDQEPSETP